MATLEKLENGKVKITIEVPAAKFEEAVEKAYHTNGKKFNVPGFRKGHAPRKMIENAYGPLAFFDDAFDIVYPEVYQAAIKEHDIEVIDRPDISIVDLPLDGKDLVFTAEVAVRPEVKLGQYKGIEIEKREYNVTDDDVAAEIEREREKVARMVDVERPVENGDTVNLDYEGSVSGIKFEGGSAQGQTLEIGSHTFIDGFEEQMIGMNAGEERDIQVKFPEKYHSEALAGADATFHVKVNGIQKKELPELDDEFAKDVSEFDTLEELKKDLTEKMAAEKKDQADSKMENDLLEQAVKNMTVEIPTVMFENKAQDMVEEFGYRLQTQGMNMDMYMKYTGTTPEALTAQFMPQAEAQVRTTLLLEKIAEVENIEITEEDINGEYDRMVKDYGMELDKVKSIVPVEEIKRQLTIQKAAKVITDSAVVTQL